MNFSLNKINKYCEEHTSPVDAVLNRLERETHLKTLAPQMASGAYQGKLLELLVRMSRPKTVLEIGTFTGYSSICIGKALSEGGMLHTIEANRELQVIIQKYIAEAELNDKITTYAGDALEIIPDMKEMFLSLIHI